MRRRNRHDAVLIGFERLFEIIRYETGDEVASAVGRDFSRDLTRDFGCILRVTFFL